MVKSYNGDDVLFFSQIFRADNELGNVLNAYGIYNCGSVCDALGMLFSEGIPEVLNSGMSANEIYEDEYEKYYGTNPERYAYFLNTVQNTIEKSADIFPDWFEDDNKSLYVTILKTMLYGSVKNFFFENRHRYLPRYDWYLIERNGRKKAVVNALFREFDKLSSMVSSLGNFVDADSVPDDFIIYLMEITGMTVNDMDKVLDEQQVRSLMKTLVNVYKYKGSLFSFELFFGCLGIDCNVKELWFDRRLYYRNGDDGNEYTKQKDKTSFDFYLTPYYPISTSYRFYNGEEPTYRDMSSPISSNAWSNLVAEASEEDRKKAIETLLGFADEKFEFSHEFTPFTYFKTNCLSFDFQNRRLSEGSEEKRDVTYEEYMVYSEFIKSMIPVFMKSYTKNDFNTGDSIEDTIILSPISEGFPSSQFQYNLIDNDEYIRQYSITENKIDDVYVIWNVVSKGKAISTRTITKALILSDESSDGITSPIDNESENGSGFEDNTEMAFFEDIEGAEGVGENIGIGLEHRAVMNDEFGNDAIGGLLFEHTRYSDRVQFANMEKSGTTGNEHIVVNYPYNESGNTIERINVKIDSDITVTIE